jgi:hypothetical protein
MKVTYTITKEDFAKFNEWHGWVSPTKRVYRMVMIGFILFVYFGMFFFLNQPLKYDAKEAIMVVLGIALAAFYPTHVRNNLIKRAEKTFEKSYPTGIKDVKLEFTEKELLIQEPNKNKSAVDLKQIKEVVEYGNLYLIYLNVESAIILAQHNFETLTAFNNFKTAFGNAYRKALQEG